MSTLLLVFGRLHLESHLDKDICLLGLFFYYYCFNFIISNQSIQIFYFFMIQSWKIICMCRNLSISSRLSNLLAYNFSY